LSPVLADVSPGNAVQDLTEFPEELTLRPGEEAAIDLPSRAGAGYTWAAEVDDEAVAEASTRFQEADEDAVGRRSFSENELLTVRGRGSGTTYVRLVQRRTWERGVEPAAAHSLKVNVIAVPDAATEQGGTT